MPSEESMKKAREVLGLPSGREIHTAHYWNRLAGRVATGLDEAKAERTEECAKAVEMHPIQTCTVCGPETGFVAVTQAVGLSREAIAASIRSLTKGPSQ